MIVRTPYRLGAFMFSPAGVCIVALESTARDANAMLEASAPYRAFHVKESSLSEAIETPTMMGMSDEYTCHLNTVPSTRYERTQVKTGSAALTVCAKETAPAPRAMTAPAWPRAWKAPIGRRTFHQPSLNFGALRKPDAQRRPMYGTPTARETK